MEALKQLEPVCNWDSDRHEYGVYVLQFYVGSAVTTIRVSFLDSTGDDLVITNMATIPEDWRGKGLGSRALKKLLDWAHDNKYTKIRAVQVQDGRPAAFWTTNGFVPLNNRTGDFVYQPEET